ncbi:MAG: hypothetical protein KGZ88_14140 [Methylomicrobium sp.]|nr:hypothetical protein [Methylomicrobium sp.]
MNRLEMEQKLTQLRDRAKRLRESAHRADRLIGYDQDMQAARRLDSEADELEAILYEKRAQQ